MGDFNLTDTSVFTRSAPITGDIRYRPIIGQFADNRYRPCDNRHQPIIGRYRIYDTQIKIDTHTF